MNSKLELIYTGKMSREEWLAYRKNGIGASEVGVILGLSPYKSSIELFYEKIGDSTGYNIENIFMFMGREQEDFIANMWQYWSGTEESLIENYRNGTIIRRCQRVNAYVRNPDYPWLFVSLDRKINKTDSRGEGALELKTISSYEAKKWEAEIPPSHVVQVQTQLLVCEFLFGELCTLKDGRRFDVTPFEFHSSIIERIVNKTKDFWLRVEEGKKIVTRRFESERNFNMRSVEALNSELSQLEPEPDGSDAYNDFLKKKFHFVTPGEMAGSEELKIHALAHRDGKNKAKDVAEDIQLHENHLKRAMGEFDTIDFGSEGKITWKKNTKGSRIFLNSIK